MAAMLALILVTLVSGYCFVTVFLPARYQSARESGYRLYFRAALYGILLVCGAAVVLLPIFPAIQPHLGAPAAFHPWRQQVFWNLSVILSLPLAAVLAYGLNMLLYGTLQAKAKLLQKAIDRRDFEKLLLYALETSQAVQVTMDNGSVYVGWIVRAPDPAEPREHLRIMPVASGYRDPATREVQLTLHYNDLVSQASQGAPALAGLKPADFEIVLPSARIVSAHIYDLRVYQYFEELGQPQ